MEIIVIFVGLNSRQMYAFITGEIAELNPAYVVMETPGIGYQVLISLHTYSSIKNLPQCRLHLHPVFREDAHTLYGFYTEEEREVFKHLISVSGIGPNTARMILSSLTHDEVLTAIQNEEVNTFNKIKGIGLKSAQRIIIDLRDKAGKGLKGSEISVPGHNTRQQEALSALILLGFHKVQAGKAVEKVMAQSGKDASVEVIIKGCLKIL